MRVIKFRAWDEKDEKMVYDFVDNNKGRVSLNDKGQLCKSTWYKLMQFTGLTDRNGKEIYEGDIVNAFWPHKDELFGVANIIFNAGCFMLEWIDDKEANMELAGLYYKTGRPRVLIVIGNIYEHKELLNQ